MTTKEKTTELFHKLHKDVDKTFMHNFTADDMIEFAMLANDPLKDEVCPIE